VDRGAAASLERQAALLSRLLDLEPLWSPVVATGGNRSQILRSNRRQKQAKTVAVGCDQLPNGAHGKEGSTVRVRQSALQKRRKAALF
jgi:hypothetical protein